VRRLTRQWRRIPAGRLILPLVVLATLLLVLAVAGCGGGHSATTTVSTTTTTAPPPSPSSTSQSSTTTTVAARVAPRPHIVYAVGDSPLPGNETFSAGIARLVPLPSEGLELFLYLGDVYPFGWPADFVHYDSIFGGGGRDLRPRTASVIGNHESGARTRGWLPYWSGRLVTPWPGSRTQTSPPYYTVALGQWKFILLDTNRGLSEGGAQYDFLVRELKEPGYHCIVVGHAPRWSSGLHGDQSDVAPFWKAMCDYGAVAYVSGHEHNSQIQPRRDADGDVVSEGGCVQIVAGAGGAGHYEFGSAPDDAAPQWGDDTHYALLRLTLRDQDFTADFIAEDGTLLHSQTFPAATVVQQTKQGGAQ
jgi:acid phosphatase type 7